MRETILRREIVAEHLATRAEVLIRYEQLGFIRSVQEAGVVGYEPAEVRRIWSILSYQRDLGVNLAGVELILRLKDQMDALHHQVAGLARALQSAIEEGAEAGGPDADG
jgi:MerR family transcriptional regulator/heat shock protein HspR